MQSTCHSPRSVPSAMLNVIVEDRTGELRLLDRGVQIWTRDGVLLLRPYYRLDGTVLLGRWGLVNAATVDQGAEF